MVNVRSFHSTHTCPNTLEPFARSGLLDMRKKPVLAIVRGWSLAQQEEDCEKAFADGGRCWYQRVVLCSVQSRAGTGQVAR